MNKKKWLLLAILPSFFLTGCWDKKDPEDRAFIITLGADRTKEGFRFSFAPANIETGEAMVYQAESKTLAGAVAQVDTHTSRKTDLGQLKTVIFGQSVLEDAEGLEGLLRELERSQSVSEKVMLLGTEGTAADCVAAAMAEDSKTGLFLWDFYKNTAEEVAVTKGMDLDTFLTERQEQKGSGVLPRIRTEEGKLRLGGGMAVSSQGVLPMTDEEERGYLFLLGEAEGALLEEELHGETIPMEISKSKAKYAFLPQGETILCQIHLKLEGALQGGGQTLSAHVPELEQIFAAKIEEEVLHTLTLQQQADYFGILPRLERAASQTVMAEEKSDILKRLQYSVQAELKIQDLGRKR